MGDGGIYVNPFVQLLTLLNINCGPVTEVVSPTPLFKLALDTTSVKVCPLTVISSKYESASLNGLCTRKPERVPARFPAISLFKNTSKGPASDIFPSTLSLAPFTKNTAI